MPACLPACLPGVKWTHSSFFVSRNSRSRIIKRTERSFQIWVIDPPRLFHLADARWWLIERCNATTWIVKRWEFPSKLQFDRPPQPFNLECSQFDKLMTHSVRILIRLVLSLVFHCCYYCCSRFKCVRISVKINSSRRLLCDCTSEIMNKARPSAGSVRKGKMKMTSKALDTRARPGTSTSNRRCFTS